MLQVKVQVTIAIETAEKILQINPDLIRESACIWYMACVTVCPTNSIKVYELNLQVHIDKIKKSASVYLTSSKGKKKLLHTCQYFAFPT